MLPRRQHSPVNPLRRSTEYHVGIFVYSLWLGPRCRSRLERRGNVENALRNWRTLGAPGAQNRTFHPSPATYSEACTHQVHKSFFCGNIETMATATTSATPMPALPPPAGETSNFKHPETLTGKMYISMGVAISLTTIFFFFRTYVRIWIKRQWIIEDCKENSRPIPCQIRD